MERIGVVVHPTRAVGEPLAALQAWAARRGTAVVQVPVLATEQQVAPLAPAQGCDLIVALGGDGTVLAAIAKAVAAAIPVLGVACGSLGALAATQVEELPVVLERLERGEATYDRLPALEIAAGSEELVTAVNDVVLVRDGPGQVVVDVLVDDQPFASFAGDGVVIATPRGSTAYALAAGGPIVDPSTRALLVTALLPHGGAVPPLVVDGARTVSVRKQVGHASARLEIDGRAGANGVTEAVVRRREDHATLLTPEQPLSFLEHLRRRGLIVDSPRVVARQRRDDAAR